MQFGEEPLVKTAAAIFQELCYNYRDQLSAGIICAGWDRKHGGQVCSRIFRIKDLPDRHFVRISDCLNLTGTVVSGSVWNSSTFLFRILRVYSP